MSAKLVVVILALLLGLQAVTTFGLFMLTMSLSCIVGTFWCRWMLRRTSVHRTVGVAAVLTLSAGVLLWSGFIALVAWSVVQRHGRPVGMVQPA